MAEDERLREALLELQFLRDREARSLKDTRALLTCLEAYSAASGPREALASIFRSLHNELGASRTVLMSRLADQTFVIDASDQPGDIGQTLTAPVDILGRVRNISNLHLLGDWGGPVDLSPFAGLIAVPVSEDVGMLTLRPAPDGFRRDDTKLAQHLAGLAVQALENSKIAAENELLAATIAGSSSGFAISDATDPERPLIYVNEAFERLSGYAAEEVLGQNCRFLSAEPADSVERRRLRQAVADCAEGTFLLRNRRKSGEMFWNELTLFPVKSPTGQVRNLVATQTEVTERVEVAAERDRVRERMERAMAATEDAFLVLEQGGEISFANSAVNRLFPVPDLGWAVGSSFAENWAKYLEEAADFPGPITSLLRAPDLAALADLPAGREVDLPDGLSVLMRAGHLEDGGLVVSATDVTAMKSAQNLLSQRLAAIEAAPNGIAVTDGAGRLLYQNAAAADLLGFGSAASGLGQRWQTRYAAAGQLDPVAAFEMSLNRKGADATATHEISASPIDTGGAVIIIRDITDELETEAREAELMRELVRLQRQEAIAQLTAGVAHDFNNLLSAINGSVTLIGMEANVPPSVQPHLDRISAAGSQSAKLIARLLDVGAIADAEGAFDLSSVLTDLPALVETTLPARVRFTVDATRRDLALQGAPGTLSQILINMVLNARDAIGPRDGQITLTVTEVQGDAATAPTVGQVNPQAHYARLSLSDDGAGMAAETAANVFRPYFTTKGRQGTGLGLATAALQVQSVGGALTLETAPGSGTTFHLYWPLATKGAAGADTDLGDGSDLQGATIIVVDDDPNVATVIGSYLEACGAEVALCQDPRDAVEAVQDDPKGWSAVVTDYDMPQMSGGALVGAVRAVTPNLPIFVVTALARRLSDPRIAEEPAGRLFSKPVNLAALSQALAAALQKG